MARPVWRDASMVRDRLLQSRSWDGAFLAHLSFRLPLLEREDIGTAGTDGSAIFYNPAFTADLSDSEKIGLTVHELMHVLLGHCTAQGPTVAENVAQDLAINAILRQKKLTLPKGALYPGEGQFQSMPDLLDWLDYLSRLPEQPQGGNGKGPGGYQPQPWGEPQPAPVDAGTDAGKIELAKRIQSAAQAATAQIGPPGAGSALAGRIAGIPAPKPMGAFDLLRAVLASRNSRQVSPTKCSNIGHACGAWLYSTRPAPGAILALVDTSGSIFDRLPRFLGECVEIASEFSVKLAVRFHTDTLDAACVELAPGDDYPDVEVSTGGTSHIQPFKALAEDETANYEAMICLTDGYTIWPDARPDIACPIVIGICEGGTQADAPDWHDGIGWIE